MSKNKITLAGLKKGEVAIIETYHDPEIALKFLELGCLPGQKIILEHIAPLGDPIAISFNGSMISLRRAEAETISITFANS